MGIKANLCVQNEGRANQQYILVNPSGAILKFAPAFKTKIAARRWCDKFGITIVEPQREQGSAAAGQRGTAVKSQAAGSRPGDRQQAGGHQTGTQAAGRSFLPFWDGKKNL